MTVDAVRWLTDPDCADMGATGGKGAALAQMAIAELPVPAGFVVCASALASALEDSGVLEAMRSELAAIDSDEAAGAAAPRLQAMVPVPSPRLRDELAQAYGRLGEDVFVAVRSSACAEDSDVASYAGQQETYLNIRGIDDVADRVRACWASFYSERALFYRRKKGALDDLAMAVVVQRQLDPDSSGVMFTTDPVRQRRDQMLVEAAWGLGEAVVSGLVIPDNAVIGRSGKIKRYVVAEQSKAIQRHPQGGTRTVELSPEKGGAPVLDADQLAQLASLGQRCQELFGSPQDIEWAYEGGSLYLLQSRPVTT